MSAFKGCLPQILLGPFLNTLSQILVKPIHGYQQSDDVDKWSFFLLGSTPCEAEEPLRHTESQEKKYKYEKHTGKLLRKNLQIKGAC